MAPISRPSIRSSLNNQAAIIPVSAEVISTPNRRQRQRGPQRDAKGAGSGAHPAVQQDHRQRQVTHHIGEG